MTTTGDATAAGLVDDDDEQATVSLPRIASPSSGVVDRFDSATTPPPSGAGVASAEMNAALRAEELQRARAWSVALLVLCAAALAYTPLLPAPWARRLPFMASLAVLSGVSLWVLHRTRREAGYTTTVFRIFGWTVATMSFEVLHFFGVFSPTPVVITLGISFFGLGLDRRYAVAVPLYAIGGYLVLATLTLLGVIPDHGVLSAPVASMPARLFVLVMVPTVLGLTLWIARLSRATMIRAVERANDALRLAGQREAQLNEANQVLDQALRADAGRVGRFTGRRVGRFELAEIIGRGAMGEVYLGRQVDGGELGAVKLLRGDGLANHRILARFLREGEIMARFDSPHIVRIHELGQVEGIGPYLAMELLVGEDLAVVLRQSRTLGPVDAIEMVQQVARGLDLAHDAGIVHRDLKPQNLFRSRTPGSSRGVWKVLDFGVSTLTGSNGTLTQRGLVGTPSYMSPEQARGQTVDRRGDVFSLGAVIYRTLVGRPPFGGAGVPQILFAVVYSMPLRPSELVETLPRDVDRVVALALAKDAARRLASAGELAWMLEAAFASRLEPAVRERADRLIAAHPWGRAART